MSNTVHKRGGELLQWNGQKGNNALRNREKQKTKGEEFK